MYRLPKKYGHFEFPKETHCNPDVQEDLFLKPWVNCKEAIGDLDFTSKNDNLTVPGAKHSDLLKLIPPGENYLFLLKSVVIKNHYLNGDQDIGHFF